MHCFNGLKVVKDYGLCRCCSDHFLFYRHHQGKRILLVVDVNDIVIVGDDANRISAL